MLSHIIYSLSFKMIYIVYLGQNGGGGGGPPGPPSKSATELFYSFIDLLYLYRGITLISNFWQWKIQNVRSHLLNPRLPLF